MAEKTVQELMTDISQRMQALGEQVSEERITTLITSYLESLKGDEAFVRKMRFGPNGSDRKLVGSKFARWGLSIGDVEFLYDVLQSAQARGLSKGPSEELQNTFEALSDAIYLPQDQVREMDRRALDNLFPRVPARWYHGPDQRLAAAGKWELTRAYADAIRAMDTAESGYGSQLIGAQYVGELWEAARMESVVFALIDTFEMSDPTAYLPVEVDFPELLFVAENTANNSSNYDTVKTGSQRVTVTAKKFVMHQMWSGEMEEDSIIAFIPFLRRQAQLGLAYYSDSLVINGDDTNSASNINSSSDPADTKHYLAFDGIRHVALVDNTGNQKDLAAAITYDALVAPRARMMDTTRKVDWGHPKDAGDLVHVADPETADAISLLDEVITLDKFGPGATVLTGQQVRIGPHPLVRSMALAKSLATGFVHASTGNNYGNVLTFNRRGFKVGWRRRIKVETERLPATDQSRIVYSLRLGFGRFTPTGAASGIEAADLIFDITL